MKTSLLILINVLFFYAFASGQIQPTKRPTEEIINSAVLLKHSAGTGSGIIISNDTALYLVTARHVLLKEINKNHQFKDSNIEVTSFQSNSDSNMVFIMKINLIKALEAQNLRFYTDKDLVSIKIGTLKKDVIFYKPFVSILKGNNALNTYPLKEENYLLMKQTKILTDIIIVGFPTSLGYGNQFDFFTPITRKGSIAGKNLTKKTIVLDCPVFPGNSGGPVFALDSTSPILQIIGIVTEFIPLADTWQSSQFEGLSHVFLENSGYAVVEPWDYVMSLIKLMN
ncbi:S1 family peptidase [Spirosoma arboris]|nr:serine protease [Spirosoma arboris]